MKYQALILDEGAVTTLDTALIEREWFKHFELPPDFGHLKRVEIAGFVFILSETCSDESRLLVIKLSGSGIFDQPSAARSTFERILRVGLHNFRNEVAIPVKWSPYHWGPLLSVYAETQAKQSALRIYFDQNPTGAESGHVYAFAAEVGARQIETINLDLNTYKQAVSLYPDAALSEPSGSKLAAGNYGIVLSEALGSHISGGSSLADWYNNKVTAQQRDFIDRPHIAPVRLRGAAGTGKTQSIAIKCLRDLQKLEALAKPARIAILTHSSALAHNVIRGMLYAMDQTEGWRDFQYARLWIGTLYELAQHLLQYERKGLQPLSADGREGRELQRMLISSSIESLTKAPKFVLDDLSKCSDDFKVLFSEEQRETLIEELMNEFACVIDAENIQKGTAEAERYLDGAREPWQLPLTSEDRRVVLDIHAGYSRLLRNEHYLSMDQMIADFNRYLLTHEWRQLRDREGFDVVFVDEYHYFNRAEAVAIHHIFKTSAASEGKLPLFMAYDLKQGPSDVALSHGTKGTLNFMATRAGRSELVELTEIFRSTPQIAEFMKDLDGSFPSMDLEGEWKPYVGKSQISDGDKPSLWVFKSNTDLVDGVFAAARQRASQLKEGGRQVAVLCMNEELFDRYAAAGRVRDLFVAITSREQMGELKYAKTKCVFSMPEFMAGLQFDTVFLVHVDDLDLSEQGRGSGFQRRFVSRCYVGASRAAKSLIIASSEERGGPSSILAGPLTNRSLVVRG